MMSGWRDHYLSIKRLHGRLLKASAVDDHVADDFRAFFIFCFHLKDWLNNDPSVPRRVAAEAEQLVNCSLPLGLCADVANGIKHYRLNRHARTDRTTRIEHLSQMTDDEPNGVGSRDVVVILCGEDLGTIWEAPDIAAACVAEWDAFLRKHGLL